MFLHTQKKKVSDLNMDFDALLDQCSESNFTKQYLAKDFRELKNRKGESWELYKDFICKTDPIDTIQLNTYKNNFVKHADIQEKWLIYCQDSLEQWFQEYLDNVYESSYNFVSSESEPFDLENRPLMNAISGRILETLIYCKSWMNKQGKNMVKTSDIHELIKEDIDQENKNQKHDTKIGILVDYTLDIDKVYKDVTNILSKIPERINAYGDFISFIQTKKEPIMKSLFSHEVAEMFCQRLEYVISKLEDNVLGGIIQHLNNWFRMDNEKKTRQVVIQHANILLNSKGQLVLNSDNTVSKLSLQANYRSCYFGGLYLSDVTIDSSFHDCIFENCSIYKSQFINCYFTRTQFKGNGGLYGCSFLKNKFTNVCMQINLDLCKWSDCNFYNINASKSSFIGNIWHNIILKEHCNFRQANFKNNKMVNVVGRSQNFSQCNFRNSFILNCDFTHANFYLACLDEIERSNSLIDEKYLVSALSIRPPLSVVVQNKRFIYKKEQTKRTFSEKTFHQAIFKECIYKNCIYVNCIFDQSVIMSDFYACQFNSCTFINSQITSSLFVNCIFNECDLAGATLHRSTLKNTKINTCSMEGMIVSGAVFDSCSLKNCYAAGWKTIKKQCIMKNTTISDVVFIGSLVNMMCQNISSRSVDLAQCNFSLDNPKGSLKI